MTRALIIGGGIAGTITAIALHDAGHDPLLGADGLRSRVRTIIDPDAPSPRYVPLLNTGGFAEGLDLPDEPGVLNMVFGKHVFFCHVVSPDGRVWWFANPARKTEPTAS